MAREGEVITVLTSRTLTFPPKLDELQGCLDAANVSPFGKGAEKVYDEGYRRAKEFTVSRISPHHPDGGSVSC